MIKNKTLCSLLFKALMAVTPMLFVACENPVIEDVAQTEQHEGAQLVLNITQIEDLPFTSRSSEMGNAVSRISYAIFNGDTKVKMVSQTSAESDFGTLKLNLAKGMYRLVVIAHNGLGNCTISSPDKITFANNKCTDTFYYYAEIDMNGDRTESISLKRAVAMFRLKITDNMPLDVKTMKFYYTGGSSTFNAVTGFGCVNSKQTELFAVTSDMVGKPSEFEVYTFPHDVSGNLKMTITAQSATETPLYEKVIELMPVTLNRISQMTTSFFGGSGPGDSSSANANVSMSIDAEWAGTDDV